MTLTLFTLGSATAYVTDAVLALSDASGIDDELMHVCATSTDWSALAGAARERHVRALVLHDVDRLRLAVTGDASVVVETSSGNRCFDGTDSWVTDTVEQAQAVTLISRACPGGGAEYRVDGGVVPAARVSRRLTAVADPEVDPFELLFGHTSARTVESAAVRRLPELSEPRAPTGVLLFGTGERVVVDRTLVLGRNPRPLDEASDGPRGSLVRLPHPGVSRRHAVIRLDRWAASIEDLGSANGTTVWSSTGPRAELRPGHPVQLTIGDVVDLGGAVSFVVEEAA